MQVNWDALSAPENGGDEVISYNLQYDDATDG
jgi:hypothetical protein